MQPPARPPYLFFSPGKRPAPAAPIGPVARPIPPDPPPPVVVRPPDVKPEVVAQIPPPRPVKRQTLIFFTPKRDAGPKDRPPPRDSLPPLPPLPNARKPPARNREEKIPVRLPGTPVRKTQPYLIFQPNHAKVRPDAPAVEKGTSPSATLDWSGPERLVAIGESLPARPAWPRPAAGSPAPPTYQVVLDSRVKPTTIPPLVFPSLDLEADAGPPAPPPPQLADESWPAQSSSLPPPIPPSPLPSDVVARAGQPDAIPAGLPPLPDPGPEEPEPIRLTAATAEWPRGGRPSGSHGRPAATR